LQEGRERHELVVDQPGFQALLHFARTGRAAVKLSGYQKFSQQAAPHDDVQVYLRALLDAFTPDACLWASDWPFLKAPVRLDVGPLVRQLATLVPDADARRRIWWDTPRRWLGLP